MPSSDYSTAAAGALRIKGGGVTKPSHKKKKRAKTETKDPEEKTPKTSTHDTTKPASTSTGESKIKTDSALEHDESHGSPATSADPVGKTEAERLFLEQKKKRLDERLKREGIKTHKERVEELNRYLSRLSEHHDMPKIGPG